MLDLAKLLNQELKTNLAPQHEAARTGDVRDSCADISQARSLLGYEARVGLEEGLRKTIDSFRNR